MYSLSGDGTAQFTAPPPTCPGNAFTFTCTVTGDSSGLTIWSVGGGSSECSLLHTTASTLDRCGSGSPFTVTTGTGFGTSATSFSSKLDGIADLILNGTLVECFGPAFSRDAENRVGYSTLQIIGQYICLPHIYFNIQPVSASTDGFSVSDPESIDIRGYLSTLL